MQSSAVVRSTHDPDEAVEFLGPVWPRVALRAQDAGFSFRARMVRLTAMGMFDVTCDATEVSQERRPWTGLVLPIDGPFDVRYQGRYRRLMPGTATIISPDEPFEYRSHASTGANFAVSIDQDAVRRTARRLGMRAVEGACQVDVNTRSGSGAGLHRYVQFLWNEAGRDGLLSRSDVASAELEGALVSALLLAANAGAARPDSNPAISVLRRVEDYIEAHLSEPILLADLAGIAGWRAETLIRAFRRRHGVTPMRFVRQRRLEEINRLLRDAEPRSHTVTDVALEFGFTQLGRFAGLYRETFGETPSETLRRP